MASVFSGRISGFLYGVGLAALSTGMALAQDSATAPEEIVVTASRIPQDIQTVGSSVSVITSQEISQFQERFALDALATTPGLDVAQAGPPGQPAGVFLRGADSYQTLVLIDGAPVDDTSGPQSAFDFGRLLATDVARIEVLRGPQSTLYGGDAIGGVINIITNHGEPGLNASGLAEFGSFNSRLFSGSVSGGVEQATGFFNVSQYNTNGFPAADARFGNHVDDGLEETQATAGGHLAPTEWLALDLALRSVDSEGGYANGFGPNGMPADEPNEFRTHERSGRLAATTNFLDGAFSGTLSVMDSFINRSELDYVFGPSTFTGERRKAEYLATGKPLDWLSLVGGVSWQQDRSHSTFDSLHTTITRAVFGEVQAQPINDLYLTAGGRLDDHSVFGPFRTYRVTGAYLIDTTGTKLHAAIGTGFRAPSLYELFDSFSGNPALRPETSRGWEFGVDQKLVDGVTVKATYFNQRIENRIDFDEATFVYFNEGHTKAQGVEMEADIQPLQSLTLRAVYTYDLENSLDSGVQIVRRPRNSASLIAAWQATDALDLTLKLHVVGSRLDSSHTLTSYATADIGAEYQLLPELMLQMRIENISDTHYEEVYGYGSEGRSVFGGVTVKYFRPIVEGRRMVKLNRIYTKTGDGGETGLGDGRRVRKDGARVMVMGSVDEANAALGLARLETTRLVNTEPDAMLARIQNDLFDLGADICMPPGENGTGEGELRITPGQVKRLEHEIDAMNADLEPLKSFVLPGGAAAAAHLHLARAVVRRAEREGWTLASEETVGADALRYLNRLSDHLFVMARWINAQTGAGDVLWKPGGSR